MQKIIVVLIVFVAFSEGCAVKRKTSGKSSLPDLGRTESVEARSILENNLSGTSFYIRKASVTIREGNNSENLTASIRFKMPDSMLISIRSKIGMEAARALLTRDTLLINDRVNKRLLTGNTGFLERRYGVSPEFIFAVLGDFIIDNNDSKRIMKCNNGIYRESFIVKERRVDYVIDCGRKKVTDAYFEGSLTSGNITFNYGRFREFGRLTFPQEISMTDDLTLVAINIKVESIETDWNGKIEFIPGAGYEFMEMK